MAEPITDFVVELLKQGGLASISAVLLYLYIKKDQALTIVYEKRVDDNNKLSAVIEATNTASRALAVTSENRSRVIESVGEATRASADAVKSQSETLEQLRRIAERNGDSIERLDKEISEFKRHIAADSAKRRA